MVIAIDNVSTGLATSPHALGGMRMYLYNFVASLMRWGSQHNYVLFSPSWFQTPFQESDIGLEHVRVGDVAENRFARVWFEQIDYRKYIYNAAPDIFVGLQNSLPYNLRIPSAVFVKSTQYMFFPEAYSPVRLWYLRLTLRSALHTATKAIVPTMAIGQDLIRAFGVDSTKLEVLPEALYIHNSKLLDGPEGLQLKGQILHYTKGRPFVLCVGATYGYKNIDNLVVAFSQFVNRTDSDHVLLLIGGEAAISFRHIKEFAQKNGVGNRVICTGPLPHKIVAVAYNLAEMLVMPSLYETFGHPILEAMACGCPTVTSNVSAMPEVAGDAAALITPHDPQDIANSMFRIWSDDEYRCLLVDRGYKRASEFTWERTVKLAIDIFDRVKFFGDLHK
jgi:glycosyltransferase involved in cell wall biosynthesis